MPPSAPAYPVGLGVTLPSEARRRQKRGASLARGFTASIILIGIAALVGGVARFGWDRLDSTSADAVALPPLGAPLDELAVVDPPAMRYLDVASSISSPAEGTTTIEQQVDVATGDFYGAFAAPDQTRIEIAQRGPTQALRRIDGAWIAAPPEGTELWTTIGENFGVDWMWTVSDVLPPVSVPFVTVIEEQDVTGADAGLPDATTPLRRYKVTMDVATFKRAEPAAAGVWWNRVPFSSGSFEVWIDAEGVVRRAVGATLEGDNFDYRLRSWSTTSERFLEPLVLTAELTVLPPPVEPGG